ncbi:MAG: four helix bundle protein [Patescibacteria group bacterium]|nr:four helix bundle protein [Patescibacteria group bacterium]
MEENKFGGFTELDVWKMAHELRIKINIITKFIPISDRHIISQIKRSSCSVATNIAEGHGRYHFQENIQFCRQARGSLSETIDHLLYIQDTKLIKKLSSIEHLINLCEQIMIKLNAYIKYLKNCKLSSQ